VFVALLLSFMAYKIYKLMRESNFFYFSLSFFLIALSYIIKIFTDLFVYGNLGKEMVPWIDIVLYQLSALEFVGIFGNLAHRFFLLQGFLVLLIIFLEIKDRRVMFLFMYFIFIISAFSVWSFLLFQTTLTVFAGTVCVYYIFHYIEHKKRILLYSLVGFSFVFLAQFSFMFTFFYERQMFVLGHIFQAVGFLLLFVTYLLVFRR
ncbi:MAG: hypothetical protein ACOCUR_02675, partial [Nanoarchaeota archaeon]